MQHDMLPEGEDLRRAIKWVSGRLLENSDQPVHQLVNETVFKFDLSPKDADFLINLHCRKKEQGE